MFLMFLISRLVWLHFLSRTSQGVPSSLLSSTLLTASWSSSSLLGGGLHLLHVSSQKFFSTIQLSLHFPQSRCFLHEWLPGCFSLMDAQTGRVSG